MLSLLSLSIPGKIESTITASVTFRPSKNGLYPWDIDILVKLCKDLEVKKVQLSDIQEFDKNWWFSNKEDTPTCRAITEHFKLIQNCDLAYPIIFSSDGRLMDGMHRVCKAHFQGKAYVEAYVFDVDPKPTYIDVIDQDDLPYD